MSQPAAVSRASLARSSPRCQPWSSPPRLPKGSSRLWSGPATKPSSEIDMWQVVSGIEILPRVIADHKWSPNLANKGVRGCSMVDVPLQRRRPLVRDQARLLPGRSDPLIADDAASRLHRYANGIPECSTTL